jgi:imidazolonepropionase
MRLSPAEALAAVTINAAFAAGVGGEAGSLEPGKLADVVIWRTSTVGQLPYWVGADLVDIVVKRGRVVYRRGA